MVDVVLCVRQADLSSYLRRMEDEVSAAEAVLSQRGADLGARSRRGSVARASGAWLCIPPGLTGPEAACAVPKPVPGCSAGGRPASASVGVQRPDMGSGRGQASGSGRMGEGHPSREQLLWVAQRPATASAGACPAGGTLRGSWGGATAAAAGAETLSGFPGPCMPPETRAVLGGSGVPGRSPNTSSAGAGQGFRPGSAGSSPAQTHKSEEVLQGSSTWRLLRHADAAAEACREQAVGSGWGLTPGSASSFPVPNPKADSDVRSSALRNLPRNGEAAAKEGAGSANESGWGPRPGSVILTPAEAPKAKWASRISRSWGSPGGSGAGAGQGAGPGAVLGRGLRPGSARSSPAVTPRSERGLRSSMLLRSPLRADASGLHVTGAGLGLGQGARPRSASSSPASTVTLRLSAFNPVASPAHPAVPAADPLMSPAAAAAANSDWEEPGMADDSEDSMSDTVLLASPVHGEQRTPLPLPGAANPLQ